MSVKERSSKDQSEGNTSGQNSRGHASEKRQSFDGTFAARDSQEFPLEPSPDHTICIEAAGVPHGTLYPFTIPNAKDFWSGQHVKMPFSNSCIQIKKRFGQCRSEEKILRWEVIKEALKTDFATLGDLEHAIKQYNLKYTHTWTFSGLCNYLEELSYDERHNLLANVLPKMAKLALQLPRLCSKPIPLLKQGQNQAITMSQKQIACLLANAFFCTFPHRNSTQPRSEYSNFPNINFSGLFAKCSQRTSEKLKTIFCYFCSVTSNMPNGLVTFQRCVLRSPVQWSRSVHQLTDLCVTSVGSIEDAEGKLQVDFAAAMVGGGVLGSGLVQEEIRFLINPELIVARLFTEKLQENECLVITGAERYSKHQGYSDSYRWQGSYHDATLRDSWLRRSTQIVAIDAVNFRNPREQYEAVYLDRELNKAYCGFSCRVIPDRQHSAIATGNWGCGAYKGDAKLKALLQIMAASQAHRDVVYYTFGDRGLERSIKEMYTFLKMKHVTVGQLYKVLEKYSRMNSRSSVARDLYTFIENNVDCLKQVSRL
uniref:poly(ADP-ribose) glycohydrolase-like n=1 Tax=Pristiophorus japonicus TaxID=55135 RepID=UPI00398ED415